MRNPKLAAEIAKQLCRFHQVEIPGSKEPQLWNDLLKFFEKGFLLLYFQLPIFDVLHLLLAKLMLGEWKWPDIHWQVYYSISIFKMSSYL